MREGQIQTWLAAKGASSGKASSFRCTPREGTVSRSLHLKADGERRFPRENNYRRGK